MAWFSLISSCLSRRLLDAPRILCDLVDRVLVPGCGSTGMDCWDAPLLKADDVPDDLASGRPSSGRCITGAGADTTDRPGGPLLDVTRGKSENYNIQRWNLYQSFTMHIIYYQKLNGMHYMKNGDFSLTSFLYYYYNKIFKW